MPLSDDDVREVIAILQQEATGELRISSGDFELHVVRGDAGDGAAPAPPPPSPPPPA